MSKSISSFELLGKVLVEHDDDEHNRGKINTVSPQPDGTVILLTDQGKFVFQNRGTRTEKGITLWGDEKRFGHIQ